MKKILVLHGPNLNLLGQREPDVYGRMTLEEINQRLVDLGRELEVVVECRHSNHEGQLIDWLHEAQGTAAGVVLNPGGYTHTSVALRDAVAATALPVVEAHLSNIHARDEFRRRSLIAPVCAGTVAGFGWRSYALGLRALVEMLEG